MRASIAIAISLALCTAATSARADDDRHSESHDGLFVRVEGGIGYLHASANYAGVTATSTGGTGMLGAALGGAIAPNLVLYGEVWGMACPNPNVQFAGSNSIAKNTTLNYGGLGLGIGFFLMPANLFLGVSLDLTRLAVTNSDGSDSHSDVGLAATVTLGKQWWISDRLGLGISLQGIGGGNRDNNNDTNSATYKTFTGLAALTFTYG